MKTNCKFLLLITVLLSLAACQTQKTVSLPTGPDYSKDKDWSIKTAEITHPVDVFFIHPTTYGPPANGKFIADLEDEQLNSKTDKDTVQWITAAFADSCNIFAPRYRQVNIEVMKMKDSEKSRYIHIPVSDIKAAFEYYLKNLNQGRPFILASHSQGSNVMQLVLLENPGMLDHEKLVAAYMPGWTFTQKDIKDLGLKISSRPDETGCLITWNTIGPGGISPTVKEGATCVNPLSWNTSTENFPASLNLGAKILIAPDKILKIKNFTSARINSDGALEIPAPPAEVANQLNMSLGKEVYHRYDYDFFFYNVKKNVEQRCAAYLAKHKAD